MKNRVLLLIVLGGLLFTSCNCGKNNIEIESGKRYLYSVNFNDPDPFVRDDADTIMVLDVRDGYMKFIDVEYLKYKDSDRWSFVKHGRISYYIGWIREIPTDEITTDEIFTDKLESDVVEVSEEESHSDITEW